MKALVTGGSGFLGQYIVNELQKNRISTVIFDAALPSKKKNAGYDPGIYEYIQGDILDFEALKNAMQGCDVIFHTAAIADVNITRKIPRETMAVNVVGTANCLECARDAGAKRFMLASSVYASGKRGNFYRVSKAAAEELCKTFFEEFSLEYTILRYGSLYGREANHWNFMYNVIKSLLTTGEYVYRSSPDAVREYIHIHDAARETVRIAMDPAYSNKSVLLTGHQRMKMRELFDTIQEILGEDVKIHYSPDSQQTHYVRTPYSFDRDVPIRINLTQYIDINEGLLDCLNEVKREMQSHEKGQ
ncbi:MAG: NAD(P)-dependent oxidoreductase [Methanoregula sp.]|nr:NAD(P)-dependent oxidoreductase [Methanoregula sp.]